MNEYNVVGVVERVLDMKKCEKGLRAIWLLIMVSAFHKVI